MKNYGVILGSRPTDYVAGALPYEIRNESGDWRPYVPTGEIQYSETIDWADWMDCVTRASTNSIEIQEKYQTGIESNYCDREVALGSGTTRQGNYLYKVADYIRHTGLGQQSTYPDSDGTWDTQYAPIPEDIKAKLAQEKKDWLTKWDIKDEDIPFTVESLKKHLKHAPLVVVVPGHAVCGVYCEADITKIFDSYKPFIKNVPGHYSHFVFAKKIVLYRKEQAIPDKHLLVDIKWMDSGKQVVKLREALVSLGWYEAKGLPDTFVGDAWAQVVWNFQKANLSRMTWAWWEALWYKGKRVDQATRNVINNRIK